MTRPASSVPPEAAKSPVERSKLAETSKPIPEPLLWSIDDLTHVLNVSRATVERLKSSGRLPKPIKIGKAVRYTCESIREWIREQATGRGVR